MQKDKCTSFSLSSLTCISSIIHVCGDNSLPFVDLFALCNWIWVCQPLFLDQNCGLSRYGSATDWNPEFTPF